MRALATAAVITGVLALLVAGCGGKSGSTTTTAALSTTDWANSVCSSLVTWTTTMKALPTGLKNNPTKSGAETAVTSAQDATKTLATDLKALGKPNTAAGQQAKDDLSKLADELSSDVNTIQSSIKNASGITGTLSAIAAASGTLTTMGQQVAATFGELQKLDAKGELEKAFSSSASCKQLTG